MAKPTNHLLGAVPGAVIASFVWWWANSAVRLKGVGLLERQPFPINNMYACAAIGAFLSIVASVLADQFVSRRRQRMETVAGRLGLSFREKVGRNSLKLSAQCHLFEDWESGRNHLDGKFDGTDVRIFDFVKCRTSRRHGSAGHDDTTREEQTVILFPMPDHIRLSVQILNHRAVVWLTTAFGFSGIRFQSDDVFLSDEDRNVLETFNDRYIVAQGLSHKEHSHRDKVNPAELFGQLEGLIGLPLMRQLLAGWGWSLELCGSQVAIWKHNKRIRPQQLPGRLTDAHEIYKHLVKGDSNGESPRLTAIGNAVMSPDVPFRQIGIIAAGGCLGMLLGAALFAPIFFMFVEEAPWIVFVWPFFGAAVMAASVWMVIKVSRRRENAKRDSQTI
jgi:hypothetical protein